MKLHLQNIEGGMQRMEAVVAAEGSRHNVSSWPFVTVPAFEVLGESVRKQTGFEVIGLCPVVALDKVKEWLQYVSVHARLWLEESRETSLSALSESGASCEDSIVAATDYNFDVIPSALMDLTSTVDEVSRGEPLGFIPSEINSPVGPFFPVWYVDCWQLSKTSNMASAHCFSFSTKDANADTILVESHQHKRCFSRRQTFADPLRYHGDGSTTALVCFGH
jgi:hypothetical protein